MPWPTLLRRDSTTVPAAVIPYLAFKRDIPPEYLPLSRVIGAGRPPEKDKSEDLPSIHTFKAFGIKAGE